MTSLSNLPEHIHRERKARAYESLGRLVASYARQDRKVTVALGHGCLELEEHADDFVPDGDWNRLRRAGRALGFTVR